MVDKICGKKVEAEAINEKNSLRRATKLEKCIK